MPDDLGQPRTEPAIRVPWPVAVLIALLVAAHVARLWLGFDPDRLALTAPDVAAGRWGGVITYLFVHANWAHLLMNSVAVLAFGSPVARYLGTGARGALAFALFFLLCGAIAGAGQAGIVGLLAKAGLALNDYALIGASGAASGFVGAAMRLIEGRGRPGPIFGRLVVLTTVAWVFANVVTGVTGLMPGVPAGAPIAWEAHLMGYFSGLLLIPFFGRLANAHEVLTR
jgi:membrane associated rhomboid family serine protease